MQVRFNLGGLFGSSRLGMESPRTKSCALAGVAAPITSALRTMPDPSWTTARRPIPMDESRCLSRPNCLRTSRVRLGPRTLTNSRPIGQLVQAFDGIPESSRRRVGTFPGKLNDVAELLNRSPSSGDLQLSSRCALDPFGDVGTKRAVPSEGQYVLSCLHPDSPNF
jgi:hypothetical protein